MSDVESDAAMDDQRVEDEEDDFWTSKKDENDDFWASKKDEDDYPPVSVDPEDEAKSSHTAEEQKEEEEEGEGKQQQAEETTMEGDSRLEDDKVAQNGVGHASTEKKKKKKKSSTEDGDKKSKKKKKKKKGESEKENKSSSSEEEATDSEDDTRIPPPTPPLFNGHALTNGHQQDNKEQEDDYFGPHDGVRSLKEVYSRQQEAATKETVRATSPLSDEEELAGVSVKQLRVSYLSAAQEKTTIQTESDHHHDPHHRGDIKPEIKADLKASVNISSLVDTYSSPQARAATPSSRPDDLTPVSLRSLKSAYEATATRASSGAVSGGSSGGSSSPVGGAAAHKEELNVSLHKLREEYCRSVEGSHSGGQTPTKTPLDTGVSIRQLTRSMNDLRTVGRDCYATLDEHDRSALASVDVKALTRSFSDLTRLEPATATLHARPSGSVSVEKLKASYGDVRHGAQSPARSRAHSVNMMQVSSECKECGKQVFQMERIVAERATWHKNCFRCKECNCILTLETYQSHEGVLYCKIHFKALFQPKVVLDDPLEARSSNKTDYGLEELSAANLKQKFKMFEQISTEEEMRPEPIPVRRSQSLLSRYMSSEGEAYGVENSELGEYEYEEDEEEEEEEEDEEEEEGEEGENGLPKKKGRPTSFSGIQDLKAGAQQRKRREELTRRRREEVARFRQMLCAGKNISTREVFEGGSEEKHSGRKEQIKIDGQPAAKNLRERFEKGLSGSEDADSAERREVEQVLRGAETANKARNLFKQIDTAVQEGEPTMQPRSSKEIRREHRLSLDGVDVEERELGRDPNLIRYNDNYEDEVDCRGTSKLLAKFRKLEMQNSEDQKAPRPLKQFTPPPEGEDEYDSDEEYSDEEYSDEEEETEEEDEEDEEEGEKKPKYKDEILEMAKSSQSARKAASLRAKFEKWETEVERNNEFNENERYDEEGECMPSIDTARNLRAMFENKAQEASQPATNRPKVKVNRFVGGGGDQCMLCDRTVYAMERLEVAGRVLHKNCFKCCKCNTKLNMNTFSIGGKDMYCTTHYKQAFTAKGTYDVFTPNKGKWTRTIEATNSECGSEVRQATEC